uniref:Early nodulin n=1 Tax=Solanum tuberosum TaxID=4113 RepID=M1BMW8_SOLTU
MAKNVSLASMDQKLAMAKRCSHEGVIAGAKAAVVASVATAIPTVRFTLYLYIHFKRSR